MCLTGHAEQNEVPTRNAPRIRLSRRDLVRGLAAGTVVAFTAGCSYNSTLGRDQLLMVSDADLVQMSLSAWAETLRTEKRSDDPLLNKRVQGVGAQIAIAAGRGQEAWEYAVFDNKEANAFVLPGNKVGVNTGLFKAVHNDDQLAAVLGHEAAHVTAHHAAERYSQAMIAQVGMVAADIAIGQGEGQSQKELIGALGLGVQYGVLMPFSRQHELEADRIGVDYMHAAGFEPVQALRLWENMASNQGKPKPPQLLSTHPSDETRIATLRSYLTQRGWMGSAASA
jgi:predicted Zn-dependent protease